MKNKKNFIKLSVALATLLLGIMLIGSTLSYLSGVSKTKINVFSIGSVETELLEPEFRVEGTTITKNTYVTNVGDVDCLVRMKVEISPAEIQVPLKDNPSVQNGVDAKMGDTKAGELWAQGCRFWLNFNTKAEAQNIPWVYNEADGFWYYQGVLSPSEDTSELFTEVKWLCFEEVTLEGETITIFKELQDFDIYIKKEATYAVYYEENGTEHSGVENGVYDQTKALEVWETMQAVGKIF